MFDNLKEAFSIFPIWVYILLLILSIAIGRGIRWWLDSRKEREKEHIRELRKQEKIRMRKWRKKQKRKKGEKRENGE